MANKFRNLWKILITALKQEQGYKNVCVVLFYWNRKVLFIQIAPPSSYEKACIFCVQITETESTFSACVDDVSWHGSCEIAIWKSGVSSGIFGITSSYRWKWSNAWRDYIFDGPTFIIDEAFHVSSYIATILPSKTPSSPVIMIKITE